MSKRRNDQNVSTEKTGHEVKKLHLYSNK